MIDPYQLVAEALECDIQTLNENSSMINHPMWDSIGHLNVMMALEEHYGVDIDDDTIRQHQSIEGILATFNSLDS